MSGSSKERGKRRGNVVCTCKVRVGTTVSGHNQHNMISIHKHVTDYILTCSILCPAQNTILHRYSSDTNTPLGVDQLLSSALF